MYRPAEVDNKRKSFPLRGGTLRTILNLPAAASSASLAASAARQAAAAAWGPEGGPFFPLRSPPRSHKSPPRSFAAVGNGKWAPPRGRSCPEWKKIMRAPSAIPFRFGRSQVHLDQLFLAQNEFHGIRHDPGSDPMTSPDNPRSPDEKC